LFKDLKSDYSLPLQTTLSGRLIDKEYSRVNLAIYHNLKRSDHLTLGKYE